MAATNAFLNYTVQNDSLALGDLNAVDLDLSGNLRVTGSINPGTFTNRVVELNNAAAGGTLITNLSAARSGTTFLLTGTGDQTINLPVLPTLTGVATAAAGVNATVGMKFSFLVGATPAAGSLFIINSGLLTSQDMIGSVAINPLNALVLEASNGVWGPTAAGQSIMTMDGGDRGGILGSYVEFESVANQAVGNVANVCWRVNGALISSSTPSTTPFA